MRTSRPLLLSPFFVSALSAFGQWTDPAGNITSTTAGTVGIGTATPSTKLTVSASGGFNTFGAAQFNLRNSVSGAVFAQQVTDSGLWQLADVGSGATKILVAAGVNGTIDFSPGPETRSSAGVGVSASVPPPLEQLSVGSWHRADPHRRSAGHQCHFRNGHALGADGHQRPPVPPARHHHRQSTPAARREYR